MRNADTVLDIHRKRGTKGLPLERVYRQLFNPEYYLRAYGKIYRNAGAMTKGTTEETVDGMDMQRIHNIIGFRASRHGSVDPCGTQEGLSAKSLGHQTYLKAKA